MKYKSSIFFILLLLSFLTLSGCTFLDSVTEKTVIEITQPISNYRDTREIGSSEYLEVALSVLVTSNKRDGEAVPVSITWNGSAPVTCYAVVNKETPCGLLPMFKGQTGQQTLVVEMEKLNGKKISDSVIFVWEPLAGFDIAFLKVAQLLGSQNPTMGLIFLVVAVMIIFSLFVAIKTKNLFGVIIVFITDIVGIILVYTHFSPELGINIFTALLGFLSASFIFSLIAYAMNRNYGLSIGGSRENYGYDQFGRPVKTIEKGGLVNVGPRYSQLPEPPPYYQVLPPESQQPGYPQIPQQYQHYLPPPTAAEREQIEQQQKPRGLARLFAAIFGQSKYNSRRNR